LGLIDTKKAKFLVSEELKGHLSSTLKTTADFVTINNEYISIKTLEEKTKVTFYPSYILGKTIEAQ